MGAIAGLFGLLVGSAVAAAAGEWTLHLTPYGWATDVGIDVAIDDSTVIDEEITAEELLEDLDTIAQLRFEAQRGSHGFYLDLFDVTLSEEPSEVALPTGGGDALVEPRMGMTLFELGGIYDWKGDGEGFQLLYGTRTLNQRAEIDATYHGSDASIAERSYHVDDTLVDGLIGVRYVKRLSNHWNYRMQADASTGGTELAWSVGPSISYDFGRELRYALTVGYRRMVIDFDTAESVDARMTLSGVSAGLRIGL